MMTMFTSHQDTMNQRNIVTQQDAMTQVGVVASMATGPAGRGLARWLGLRCNRSQRAELRIVAANPLDPWGPTGWTRRFGQRSWRTAVAVSQHGDVSERIGPLTVWFDVHFENEATVLRSKAVSVGPFRCPGRLAAAVLVRIHDHGAATISTIAIDLGKLGHLRYVASMRDEAGRS